MIWVASVFPSLSFLFHDVLACRKIKCMVVEFLVFLGHQDFASYLGLPHLKNIRKFFSIPTLLIPLEHRVPLIQLSIAPPPLNIVTSYPD